MTYFVTNFYWASRGRRKRFRASKWWTKLLLTDLHDVVSRIKARNISFAGQLKIFVYHLLELSLRKSRCKRLHVAFDKDVPCKSALTITTFEPQTKTLRNIQIIITLRKLTYKWSLYHVPCPYGLDIALLVYVPRFLSIDFLCRT